jgi:ATP-dependent exoDNAse (exonuclease V) beta subunit
LLWQFWAAVYQNFKSSPTVEQRVDADDKTAVVAKDADQSSAQTSVATPLAPMRLPAPLWQRVAADFDPATGLMASPWPEIEAITRMEAGQAALEFDWGGPGARAAGTVVHEELERLARAGDLVTADFASRTELWRRRLLELGMAGEQAARIATQLLARLEELRRDSLAQWLLSTPHDEAHCELRLSGIVEGRLQNAVIDRSFIANGVRWVVDYKTGTHVGGGLETFLAQELQRYRPQLQRYRALAMHLGPQPVRAALYFPWLGVLRELLP